MGLRLATRPLLVLSVYKGTLLPRLLLILTNNRRAGVNGVVHLYRDTAVIHCFYEDALHGDTGPQCDCTQHIAPSPERYTNFSEQFQENQPIVYKFVTKGDFFRANPAK